MYLGPLPLRDALRDPDDIATLLLLQFDVGVEDSEVELLQKGKRVQFHLGNDNGGVKLCQRQMDFFTFPEFRYWNSLNPPHI